MHHASSHPPCPSEYPSRYPREYERLRSTLKRRVEQLRENRAVQQYSGSALVTGGVIKMGATFNFIFIDGECPTAVDGIVCMIPDLPEPFICS